MSLTNWLSECLQGSFRTSGTSRRPQSARRSFRLDLEALEDRTLPSVVNLVVDSLSDTGKGTLRGAIQQANKGKSTNTYEIDIVVPGAIQLESSLPDLANPITIKGLGLGTTALLRDTHAAPFRLITVDAGKTAAMSGMQLGQGNAGTANGGAIDNFGTLTLDTCSLTGNMAASGGAVVNEAGATLIVTNTGFTGNAAGTYTGTQTGYGGAIQNYGTLDVVNHCVFTNNSATAGGAVNNTGTLTVGGCIFAANRATNHTLADYGGAINNAGTAIVAGCEFSNNESDNNGGAIYSSATLKVANSQFTGNNVPFGSGGAISTVGDALLGIATFTGNTARDNGGAVFSAGTLTVQDASLFVANTARNGGAIFNNGTATVSQTVFTGVGATPGNSAQFGGAIMNWQGANLTLNAGANFSQNSATNVGGAVYNFSGSVTVNQALFSLNLAPIGDAIENYSGSNLTVNAGTSFTANGNGLTLSGGAINNSGTLTATGAAFVNNMSADGGAIATDGVATISACTFSTNQATSTTAGHGGGAIWNNGSLTVQGNSSFDTNATACDGGALFNHGTATVSQASFAGNTATSGGAIENLSGANLTLNPSTSFSGNTADYGGAIDNSTGAGLAATGAAFTNNTANLGGGAVANHGDATFTSCPFSGNQAVASGDIHDGGGAIWNDGKLILQGVSNFSDNTANFYGGSIDNFGTAVVGPSSFTITSATPGNAALAGGAIMNGQAADLTINPGAIFVDLSATQGGAIENVGTATLSRVRFTNDSADYGGAIENRGALTATGSMFDSNMATDQGGAISNVQGALTVAGSTFTGNHAVYFGGAISNYLAAVTISGCTLTYNEAGTGDVRGSGGAIINLAGALTVSDCGLYFNSATNSGGGIYTGEIGTTYIAGSEAINNLRDDVHTESTSTLNVFNSIIGVNT
jgi:predicted outer membrane repeat protein